MAKMYDIIRYYPHGLHVKDTYVEGVIIGMGHKYVDIWTKTYVDSGIIQSPPEAADGPGVLLVRARYLEEPAPIKHLYSAPPCFSIPADVEEDYKHFCRIVV